MLHFDKLQKEKTCNKLLYNHYMHGVFHTQGNLVALPQSLQSKAWTQQKFTEISDSWIAQLVFTQVQLSQMGGVKIQS